MPRIWFKYAVALSVTGIFLSPIIVSSVTVDELRQKISTQNQQISKLETEIAQYQKELKTTGTKANTLQTEINRLETMRKKLVTDITLTENKIGTTNLTIEKIEIEINDKTLRINKNQTAIAELIRQLREHEQSSLVEVMIGYDHLSNFFTETDQLRLLQTSLDHNIGVLESIKGDLEKSRNESEAKHRELKNLLYLPNATFSCATKDGHNRCPRRRQSS